jgi:DtxR family Mn-dependent transcriptional regulator
MPSITVENYVKQIYLEAQRTGGVGGRVSMGRLAAAMGVVPGTVTTMVKALGDAGLVEYEPRGGVTLTRGGEQLALHVLRRHRLVELLLVRVLGLDWSEVHAEAEELEHAISDKVLERIDALLGRPTVDPHGDPIPSAKGKVDSSRRHSLADCPIGVRLRVARVTDQDPAFLQFVDRAGLVPGAAVVVEGRDATADAVLVRPVDRPAVTLGGAAARKVLVEQ